MGIRVKFMDGKTVVKEINSIGYLPVDTKATKDSDHLATSAAVESAANDVVGFEPAVAEEETISGTGLTYESGKFYAFDGKIYYCTTATSTEATFTLLGGTVAALNYLVELLSEE